MSKVKHLDVSLASIYLDNENPRHDPIDSEPEIIELLVKRERVAALAREIVTAGGTSPLERIALVPHLTARGKFVAVEGNRRVCALKLLRDPAKAPTSATRKSFAALASDFKAPAKIEAAVFPDRKSARYWLRLRHLGEQGGVGVRKWNAKQKTRFDDAGDVPNANALALQVVDYAEAAGFLTEHDRERIALTTLTRYLSNPLVRDALGIASRHDLEIVAPPVEFDRAISAFLKDAARTEDPPVHSRSNQKEREAYAASLRSAGFAVKTKLARAVIPSAQAAKKRQRNNPNPDYRPKVVPADFRAVLKTVVLKRIFDELRTIDPDLSFAAGYLLRAFVEQLAHDYARRNGLGNHGELHAVIGRCEKHLGDDQGLIDKHGSKLDRLLKPLRTMAHDKDSRLSPDTLGAWVHGSDIPTGSEIKRRWDALQPSLELLIDSLK